MKTIRIQNIKSIKDLTLNLPDQPGVYLLTGGNGIGKSSILGAIYRIGASNAFSKCFVTCRSNKKIDNFEKSSVTYTIDDGTTVSYKHRRERWVPTPKKGNVVLKKFGYNSVNFFAVDERRIVPSQNEFEGKSIRWKDVNQKIKETICKIFDSNKYQNLKICNSNKGTAYSIPLKNGTRYTEKNFSSGEINVLRFLASLESLNGNDVILVDEIEMSLHPKAQKSLLKHLQEYANEKKSIIIFSTHSETLIRAVPYKKIFLLYKNGEDIKLKTGAYPEEALSEISERSQLSLDFLILVEDFIAQCLAEKLYNRYTSIETNKHPRAKIIAGVKGKMGYPEIIELGAKLTASFPLTTIKVLLDKDAEPYVKTPEAMNPKGDNSQFRTNVEILKDRITYLPVTPEQGLCKWLCNKDDQVYKRFTCSSIKYNTLDEKIFNISRSDFDLISEESKEGRDKAKNILDKIIGDIRKNLVDIPKTSIVEDLFTLYSQEAFSEDQLRSLFGRLLTKV